MSFFDRLPATFKGRVILGKPENDTRKEVRKAYLVGGSRLVVTSRGDRPQDGALLAILELDGTVVGDWEYSKWEWL